MIACACGASVDPDAFRAVVEDEIAQGETLLELGVEACPACAPNLDGDGYIFTVVVE